MLQRKRTVIEYVETEPGVFEPAPPRKTFTWQDARDALESDLHRMFNESRGTRPPLVFYDRGAMLHGDWSAGSTEKVTTIKRTGFFLENLDGITGGE